MRHEVHDERGRIGKLTLIKGAIDGIYRVRETAKRLKLSARHKAAETVCQGRM
jgi:ribosomal protein L30/L7E